MQWNSLSSTYSDNTIEIRCLAPSDNTNQSKILNLCVHSAQSSFCLLDPYTVQLSRYFFNPRLKWTQRKNIYVQDVKF